jgi:putative ABC transport system permease protein
LVQIDRVRPTLLALVGLIAVLGVIGLGHYLGLSIRQRRGELAVLRSLGFVRRQVRASVTWQALAVSSVGIVIGVPLGVVVGRWSWLAAVGNLGIVDAPTTPIVALAAVCAAMAIGTALVAVLPGLAAGRRRPAQDLRTE